MLFGLFLSFFASVNAYEMLISYKMNIPELTPAIEYNGKFISLIDSENVYITVDDDVIIDENKNMSIQDQYQGLGPSLWNLDRLDGNIDNKYTYTHSGSNSIVYVIDSGIYLSPEFENRIKNGMSFVRGSNFSSDCLGHGTHVSSIIASKSYGVAKNAIIVPVKVFGCYGTTYTFTILQAIYWVIKQPKGIVNLSLGGTYNYILNDAIKDLIDAGFIVVSAAGNNGRDACEFSPSSEPNSIVVGCTDSNKMICSFSNEGSCVTLFAPGRSILGLSNYPFKTRYMSGTSMSAPHVSGIAATLYEKYPNIEQRNMKQLIVKIAANGSLTGFKIGSSPNLEVRGYTNITSHVCDSIRNVRECRNSLFCSYIPRYGCRSYNFCSFRTRYECSLRKRCKYTSGRCSLK